MAKVNLDTLKTMSTELDKLQVEFAFLGGSILGFLLDNPSLVRLRVTDDVDAIANVVTLTDYSKLESRLRKHGFTHDTSEGAPICRWVYGGHRLDIMPVKDYTGTMNSDWFEYAMKSASLKSYGGLTVRTISATCFLATKLAAFQDRGNNDYYGSHDLEDIVTVVNGRENLLAELELEEPSLRTFVAQSFGALLERQSFHDALPGHLEPDEASQLRLPFVLQRWKDIAALSAQI